VHVNRLFMSNQGVSYRHTFADTCIVNQGVSDRHTFADTCIVLHDGTPCFPSPYNMPSPHAHKGLMQCW
jgi:hypothetical protein